MQLLYATRADIFTHRGGDTTQVEKTIAALHELTPLLETHIIHSPEALNHYPAAAVLHAFDMRPDTMATLREAKRRGLPVVLTPIYWDFTPMYAYNFVSRKLGIHGPRPWLEPLQHGLFSAYQQLQQWSGKKQVYLNKAYCTQRHEALALADAILPNSPEEGAIIAQHFDEEGALELQAKMRVVPNAVEAWPEASALEQTQPLPHIGELRHFVLEVARIEPNKNQLGLLQAMCQFPDVPLVLIGRLGTRQDDAYFRQLQALARKRGNTFIIPELAHTELPEFYRRARVHAMPSFRESAGLSSMEALISGCEIVVSEMPYCPTTYYQYTTYAHQANPWHVTSIAHALEAAMAPVKKNTLVPQAYLQAFSYTQVARLTYACYLQLTQGHTFAYPENAG